MATVPEIHEALLAQAAQQKKGGGDLDEDDEEEAERVKVSQKSPFVPVKVNKAKERQQIIEWARKRLGRTQEAAAAEVAKIDQARSRALQNNNVGSGSANHALERSRNVSASAPAVGGGSTPAAAAAAARLERRQRVRLGAGDGRGRGVVHGAAWRGAPQRDGRGRMRADPSSQSTQGRRARAAGMGGVVLSTAPARSAPALHDDLPGSLPRMPSAEGRPRDYGGGRPPRKNGRGAAPRPALELQRRRSFSSASGPPPKDLGTMIYWAPSRRR